MQVSSRWRTGECLAFAAFTDTKAHHGPDNEQDQNSQTYTDADPVLRVEQEEQGNDGQGTYGDACDIRISPYLEAWLGRVDPAQLELGQADGNPDKQYDESRHSHEQSE